MTSNQPITFIIPCRNNLKYLQQAVQSIESNYGEYHHIVILDDASTDGTNDWVSSINKPNIISYYGKLFDDLQIYSENKSIIFERYLMYKLNKKNITIIPKQISYDLIRV